LVNSSHTMEKAKKYFTPIILIALSLFSTIPVIKTGIDYPYGIGFWGSNGHDGIWHLSLINSISNPLKITMPIFSGSFLVNYHPFFDILIAFLSRLTRISPSILLFQIFPLISSFFIVLLSYKIGLLLFKNKLAGLLLASFNVFSNSAGWIYSLVKFGDIRGGESIFWAMQSPSIQLNPPFALSILFSLLVLYQIISHYHQKNLPVSFYLTVFLSLVLLPITKAYSALFIFPVFFIFSIQKIRQSQFKPIIFLFITTLIAFAIYKIYNPQSSSLFEFKPFWFTESLIESPDRFYLPKIANARYTLQAAGLSPRLILIYIFSIAIFYIGNYFTRILGILKLKLPNSLHLLLLPPIILLSLIPLIFIQSGTPWNTIQFLYYSMFFSNIFLVNFLIDLPSKFKLPLIITVLLLNLIPSLFSSTNYLTPNPSAYISQDEISALSFLSKQSPGTVLTYPYDKYAKQSLKAPLPIWAYETTSYVPAYSQHPVFVADEMNLSNSGYDLQTRLSQSNDFFKFQDKYANRGFLVNNQISYIYLLNHQAPTISQHSQDLYISQIYSNPSVTIFKVER